MPAPQGIWIVDLDCDIIERLPNGTALTRLNKLADYSDSEFFAVDFATKQVAARAKTKS